MDQSQQQNEQEAFVKRFEAAVQAEDFDQVVDMVAGLHRATKDPNDPLVSGQLRVGFLTKPEREANESFDAKTEQIKAILRATARLTAGDSRQQFNRLVRTAAVLVLAGQQHLLDLIAEE